MVIGYVDKFSHLAYFIWHYFFMDYYLDIELSNLSLYKKGPKKDGGLSIKVTWPILEGRVYSFAFDFSNLPEKLIPSFKDVSRLVTLHHG